MPHEIADQLIDRQIESLLDAEEGHIRGRPTVFVRGNARIIRGLHRLGLLTADSITPLGHQVRAVLLARKRAA